MPRPAACVFCASSSAVPALHHELAAELGRRLAASGRDLVYGGTRMGSMGALAAAAQAAGARVVAVVPQSMVDAGLVTPGDDEVVVTADLHTRKAEMVRRADAFVVLPGGFGTLDELLAVLTLKHLHQHAKALVIVNTGGYFDPLLDQFAKLFADRFAHPDYAALYAVVADPAAAVAALDGYRPPELQRQWL